jgi:two-component system cell cycle sensor histidine kinase/response regulator CckA
VTLHILVDDDDAFRRGSVVAELRRLWPDADVVEAASATAHPPLDPGDDRFRALANSSSLLIWMSDPDSRVVFMNQRWLDFTGRTLEQELGDGWIEGVHPDDRVRVERYMRAHERRGEPYTQQYRVLAADGEYRTVVDAASPMVGPDGTVLGYAGTTLDITDQLRAEQHRMETEVLLTTALEASPVGVGFVDENLRFVRLNKTLASFHDLPVEEHLGRTVNEVLAPLGVDLEAAYRRVLQSGAAVTGVDMHVDAGGAGRSLMCSYHPVRIDGRIAGVGIVSVDVTEREQLEAQLLQSQKLEAVGRLAGGLAHDFNNLLGVIDGYAHLIGDSLPEADERRGQALEISRASRRGADLTRRLLSFSRQQVLVTAEVDLRGVVVDLTRLLERLVPSAVALRVETGAEPAFVLADSSRLGQVLVNLVINAIDAMPFGGDLVVRVDGGDSDVQLTVSDTGVGIDDHALARIFEPFYTTKEHGSGLGLSTVHGVVEQLGGHIVVESRVGAGSTFTVALPRAGGIDAAAGTDVPDHVITPGAGRGDTVLVAEDSDLLRSLIRSVLERAGYVVRLVGDGEEAVAAMLADGPPAIVVADVEMPRMGGLELCRRLEESHPGTPILLISGYATDGEADDLARREFLQKPFTPAQLIDRIRSLLDRGARPGATPTIS